LFVSNRAHLILPYHTALERAREKRLGGDCVGTTMRGIGPAYEDKAGRVGIRIGDLSYPRLIREKIQRNVQDANQELASLGVGTLDWEQLAEDYLAAAARLIPYSRDVASLVTEAVADGRSLLLEGAQGTMLDLDHGTYPFVTSSSATAGGAAIGAGLPPQWITGALGIAKAYTTRVGGGPFPTELEDDTGAYLRKRGNEFGASTGRPRRTGWFDAVVVRYSNRINAFDAIALPKLDVLDELDEIRICVGYKIGGELIETIPYGANVLAECKPVYETLPGWRQNTSGVTDFDRLPGAAKNYIARIEELVGASVALISTGPERNETIIRKESAVARWMT
jgi:adenylosuccinate synthase